MALVDLRLHAADEKDAALARVGLGIGADADLAVPGDGDGVEADSLGLVDVLEEAVAEVEIDGIALAMAVKFNPIGRHDGIMARVRGRSKFLYEVRKVVTVPLPKVIFASGKGALSSAD
jgi:hypothetical protein